MKRVLSTIVAFLIAVGFAAITFAAEPAGNATPAASASQTSTAKPAVKVAKKTHHKKHYKKHSMKHKTAKSESPATK